MHHNHNLQWHYPPGYFINQHSVIITIFWRILPMLTLTFRPQIHSFLSLRMLLAFLTINYGYNDHFLGQPTVETLDFCGQRPPQLVVAEGNNIFEVTETHIRGRRPLQLFVAEGKNIFEVRETHIRDRRPPYLLVTGGHKTF